MAETSTPRDNSELNLPDDCGYNKIFEHQWHTHVHALPLTQVGIIHSIATSRWGWHFIPHKNMNYENDDWYKDQTLVLSFFDKDDLINSKFSIDLS